MTKPTRAELEARVRALERAARRREKFLGALRASETRYGALIEHSDDLIMTCRLDGTITEVNQAASPILGHGPDQLIGRKMAAILTPASLAAVDERVRRAVAGERLLRIFSAPARAYGPCAAPARRHHDASRPVRCRERRGSLSQGPGARRAARHAPLVAHCHFGLGKLSRRTGKRDEAGEHLTAAAMMYRDMDMRFWLTQAEAETSEVRCPATRFQYILNNVRVGHVQGVGEPRQARGLIRGSRQRVRRP